MKHPLTELIRLFELEELSYIDLAFVEQFQKNDEELGALYCYLLVAMRSGHLCVQIEEEHTIPDIGELFPKESERLRTLILRGAKKLPQQSPGVIREGNRYYLQKNWSLESECIVYLHKLLSDVPKLTLEITDLPSQLNQEQKQAINAAASQCLTIISGGPGTGKTYTAGYLISLLVQTSPKLEIVLAAPTGKAASNLQQSIQRTANLKIKAVTLHSLLGFSKWNRSRELKELTADVILIDESSMIDAKMMVRLLSSVKKGGRLIMLGDPHQLPPVETGNIFNDMVDYLEGLEKIHVTSLKRCLRAENRSLIDFAKMVQRGECQAALHCLTGLGGEVCSIEVDPVVFSCSHFSYLDELEVDDPDLMKKLNQFRCLSPLRKGELGVEFLNRKIQDERLKKKSSLFPIILTHHAKDLELYNGDTGLLVMSEKKPFALFEDKNLALRRIPLFLLPTFEFAYCLSVHKSQGSEFNHVFLLLPEGSEVFGRQSFYTAVTRAKQKLSVMGSEPIIREMIGKKTSRISGLEKRLQKEYELT